MALRTFSARVRADLMLVVKDIQNPKALVAGVTALHSKYCGETTDDTAMALDEELQQEHNRQREFLERSIASLRHKVRISYWQFLSFPCPSFSFNIIMTYDYDYITNSIFAHQLAKNAESHQAETVRVMKENVSLIKEINELRAELAAAKSTSKALEVRNCGLLHASMCSSVYICMYVCGYSLCAYKVPE